ncbi:AAA family ATPase [uncultured Clostridium sp.]|jgi:cytidylate kinase|uniref:cytidylate kinase-like family protein n=1 Tax=uncultured Clostridium sp. TaxID=59620 RepID=UPI0025CF09BD|nr:cytidylate kinase-like family protein [uncultured Clostridium sp.]
MDNFVVTITRSCGSGGSIIANLLAKQLNIKVYDKELLKLASDDSGINERLFAMVDEDTKKSILYKVSKRVYNGELIPPESNDFTSNDNLFNYQAKVLKELAKENSYIVIGRGADYVLRDNKNVIKIFVHANNEECILREMKRLGMERKEAEEWINKTNIYRGIYYRYHTGQKWRDAENYDLILNTSRFSYDECVEIIKKYIKFIQER